MLLIQIAILAVLLIIFLQDLLSRSVYWILFPLLVVLFLSMRLISHQYVSEIWPAISINVIFLLLQLLVVSAWFSLKKGKWVNITTELLGWGDILFLLSAAAYLSVLSFLFFYISSLIAVMVIWFIRQVIVGKKTIPLAGFQAILLAVFLVSDWWLIHINVMNDDWLLQFLTK